jgi:hypothetical protein
MDAPTTAVATAPQNNAVAVMPDIAALQAASDFAGAGAGLVGTGVAFLPYLQLYGSNSEEAKRGLIPIANYGTVEGKEAKLTDCGKTILVVPCAWRSKAMWFKAPDGKPKAFHNQQSEQFKKIRAAADADSNSGNMYGPEYLFWFPAQKRFVTFFMGSKTARNAAGAVHALLPRAGGGLKGGMLTGVLIDNGTHTWHGPTISPSDQSFEMPDPTLLLQTVGEFLQPRDSVLEEAAPAATINSDR